MDYLSTQDFFENVNIRKQLTTRTVAYTKNASNQINDLVIDFSQCSNYVVDLRGATYVGSNDNIQISIVGGSQNNTRSRLKIIQADTVTTELTVSFVGDGAIRNVAALEYLTNQNAARVAFEFDFISVQGGSNEYVPIGITSAVSPYVEDTDYTSTSIVSTGDSYLQAISKLDAILSRLIPPSPPYINDPSVTLSLLQSTTQLHKLSDGELVPVVTSAEPSFRISAMFVNTGGTINSQFNDVIDGTIDLSTSTLSNLSLSILKGKDATNYYDVITQLTINSANKNDGALANAETLYTVKSEHNDSTARSSNIVSFRKCRATAFPIVANPTDTELIVPTLTRKVSGLSVLGENDEIGVQARYKNVTFNVGDDTGFYPSKVGELSGAGIQTTNVNVDDTAFSDMIANSPDTDIIVTPVAISANAFVEGGLSVTAKSSSPQGTSIGTQISANSGGLKVLVDSVTDVNSGSVQYVFDHSLSLVSTDTLMILNGRIQYPYNDWSSYIDGINYSNISGWRKLTSKVLNVAGFSRIRVTLPSPIGFEGAIENSNNYRLELTRSDKPGEVYDGNAAYDGVGIVAHNEGCLLLANSTASEKVVTFGEVIPPGVTATITIYLNDISKSFGQGITYVAF